MKLAFFAALAASLVIASATHGQTRPNVVFILVDDMGWGDLGVFHQNGRNFASDRGAPAFVTPTLDAMAAAGVQLRRHYCPAPVCAPSRASLLLGVHQGHANVRDNAFDKALEDNHTLGTVLRQAGYATALIGKYGLQGSGLPAPARPELRGFDFFFGYLEHGDAHFHYPKETGANVYDGTTEVTATLDKCYSTDLIAARAKKWMVDHHAAHPEQPFFALVTFTAPHARLDVPTMAYPAGRGTAGGIQWSGTPGSAINTASGTINSWIHPDYATATWDNDGNPATTEVAWPDYAKRHATMIRRVDDAIDDILHTLDDLGVGQDTLVVFTSDNGPHNEAGSGGSYTYNPTFFDSFGPLDGIKRDTWEGGLRVPTLARWPARIPAGRISTTACQFHDWLPTFAEIAGVPAPARTDGVSLLPTLTGEGTQRPGTVYVEYFFGGSTPTYAEFAPVHRGATRNQQQVIHVDGYKGVRYNVASAADDFRIHDTLADPQETTDLAGTSAFFTALQQKMKDRVLQVRRPSGGVTRPYDSALVPAVQPGSTVPGLDFAAYEGAFPWVPDVTGLPPVTTGQSTGIDLAVRPREADVALHFTGWLVVPSDGTYTFHLTTDARAFLRLHDAAVIDADFPYTPGSEVSASVNLAAGRHPIRLTYARGSGGGTPSLSLEWSGPGLVRQAIPAANLVRAGASVPSPPVAANDDASTDAGLSVTLPVLANDADDGTPQPLSIARVDTPAHGTAQIAGAEIIYTPRAGFFGQDSFAYTATDGEAEATATVTVSVHPAQGAFLWLPLDEPDGTVAYDAGGRPRGTLRNFSATARIDGRFGRALGFDGTDDVLTVEGYTPPLSAAARTFLAWLRPAATQSEFAAWLSYGTNTNGNRLSLRIDAGRLRCEVQGGFAIGTRLLNDGEWHHAAAVVSDLDGNGTTDVSEVRFFVDGVPDPLSSSSARAINTTAGPVLTLGGSSHAANYEYRGDMDDVRILASPLTAAQVAALAGRRAFADAWYYRHSGEFLPELADWLADGDGDGLNTFLEFAFGGNPTAADSAAAAPTLEPNLTFAYNRRRLGLPASAYVPESSADLVVWEPLTGETIDPHASTADFDRVRLPLPPNPGSVRFFRLKFAP